MKRLMMATAFALAALTIPTWAQSPAEHDPNHPTDSAKSAPVPPAASPSGMGGPQGGMGNMPMMGMMKDMHNMMSGMSMMNMMGMMQTMGMMGPGMGGMATIDRVEGRIAFLRTELKITDAQASVWNGFADALRANAKKLAEVRASMLPKPGDAQPRASTLAERLDLQEQWLQARLDGTRAMKSAFAKLNETLSDDQKKAANDLLAPHMGMGMMGMMGSQMGPGQMGPGQMQPGQMRPGQMGPGRMQPGAR
ncbi:MAG TPA: Spy/CpxP family protein refolding chaperone [Bradyrhizobium sp.]|nr:Spy/CpxP family protein refolding chaperone [Bradyrhizobium sp.]